MSDNSFSGVDSEFFDTFRTLTYGSGSYSPKQLPAAKTPPAIPSRSGASVPVIKASGGTSGGIASPLIEPDYASRTFWPQRVSQTPDGLFTMAWSPLKSVVLLDANNASVVLQFKDPVP